MTDTEELKRLINSSGFKLSYIADQMELTTAGLRKKINGENEFKASEILKMAEILGMDKKKRDNIFLTIR